jgi:hypothetical protein
MKENITKFELLKRIWAAVYDPLQNTETVIQQYFHPDYEQCINDAMVSAVVSDRATADKHASNESR